MLGRIWQRLPRCPRHRAAQDSFAAATLPRCCDDACTASSRGVSSIYQTQDQCPSLAPARAVGGGTPLGLGGFLPPLDDSKGAWTNFEPSRPSPHTTPHRIRACTFCSSIARDCRSAGASQGGAAMTDRSAMLTARALCTPLPPCYPCARALACTLTSHLASPRSVMREGYATRFSGRADRPTLWYSAIPSHPLVHASLPRLSHVMHRSTRSHDAPCTAYPARSVRLRVVSSRRLVDHRAH